MIPGRIHTLPGIDHQAAGDYFGERAWNRSAITSTVRRLPVVGSLPSSPLQPSLDVGETSLGHVAAGRFCMLPPRDSIMANKKVPNSPTWTYVNRCSMTGVFDYS